MTKKLIKLEVAQAVAAALIHHLSPHTARIEVAGSIRRQKKEVGDVEIVCIPRFYRLKNLLGEEDGPILSSVDEGIQAYAKAEATDRPAIKRMNDGTRYIKLHEEILDIQVDLFCVHPPICRKCTYHHGSDPQYEAQDGTLRCPKCGCTDWLNRSGAQWGPIFAIRTGSAVFSRRLVTALHVRDMESEDGHVVGRSGIIDCPREEDFFRLASMPWRRPEDRR